MKLAWWEKVAIVGMLMLTAFTTRSIVNDWNDPPKQEVTVVKKEVTIGEDCWKK